MRLIFIARRLLFLVRATVVNTPVLQKPLIRVLIELNIDNSRPWRHWARDTSWDQFNRVEVLELRYMSNFHTYKLRNRHLSLTQKAG